MELKIIDDPEVFFQGLNAEGYVFLNPQWQRLLTNQGRFFGIFKGHELLAFFQVIIYRRLGQNFVIHPPFSPNCGFTLVRKSKNNYSAQTELKRMLRLVADYFSDKSNANYVDIVFPWEIIDMQPFIWTGFRVEPKYSYWISTSPGLEELLKNMSPERKKNIRDAEASGYELTFNNQPDVVRTLIEDSLKNTSIHFDSDFFEGILHGDDTWRFWTLISQNEKALAASVIIFDREKAWYVAGGYDHQAGDALAGTWALWNAILEVKRRGIPNFDFNGSSIESIEKYFRGFGADLKTSFRILSKQSVIGKLKNLKNQFKNK